ncbi:MAG: thiolase domain-containing protein [Promethearchaeota archaeon]
MTFKNNIRFPKQFSKKKRVAIVGAGMTDFRSILPHTTRELCFEASKRALDSCGLTPKDLSAVIGASAPDAFDGIHMKGWNPVDAMGAVDKPYAREFVGGGTGVGCIVNGWYYVASGLYDIVLVVAFEKMAPPVPHAQKLFLTIFEPILEWPLGPNLVWIFAQEMNRYMTTWGVKKETIALSAVKNKGNARDHPHAQLPMKITVEDVLNSPLLVWPVNRLDISPSSDGAAAIVLASEDVAKKITDSPVWIDGVGMCIDSQYWTNRDLAFPYYVYNASQQAYRMAGMNDPMKDIDVWEPYDPFDYKELHHLDGLMGKKGYSPKLLEEGQLARDGDYPSCPSGGLQGVGNPIAAAGTMKVCELYWQLTNQAGKRQIDNAKTGIAQAWGDLMQVATVVVCRT